MAFDGITIAALTAECGETLTGARLSKIAQPEKDALLLTFKTNNGQKRLYLSADASLPLLYLTDENKPSPMTAPGFCMLLRKHLQNGRLISVTQPGLERIVCFTFEHLDEMGDLCRKNLIIEIMGKHSNIIFCDDKDMILDSIKHISGLVSSVREVLPGRPYFIPKTSDKADPLSFFGCGETPAAEREAFKELVFSKSTPVFKAIYSSFTGISPVIGQELCARAGMDPDRSALSFANEEPASVSALYSVMEDLVKQIAGKQFSPMMAYENGTPKEYAAVKLGIFGSAPRKDFSSISELLTAYYREKEMVTRIRQKSYDLRKIVQTALERSVKKYDLQLQQMKDTEKKDTYRLYGELLHTYGHSAQPGAKSIEAIDYYTGNPIVIPLDPTLTAMENAKRYFDKYGKMKRTFESLSALTVEVKAQIDHLESIAASLDIAEQESDLAEIREELVTAGYIKRHAGAKKAKIVSKPFHYISSDGFHMYVGKNNTQNDYLTFKFGTGGDWWFHAKKIPGSHVLVKTEGKELPDSTFEEAARLAAYYSKGREQTKVEVDYIEKKHVKKPGGSAPGFVVYYTNYSMTAVPDITGIQSVE